jgi:hypothetical protein
MDSEVVNPFVNLKKRAIELPAGCKDLSDVLSKVGALRPGVAQYRQGGFEELRICVRQLHEEFYSTKYFCVSQIAKRVLLMVERERDSFKLWLMVRTSDELMKEAITEIFGEAAAHPQTELRQFEIIRVTLPENWEDAAQVLIDFFLRAYSITEQDKFILSFHDQKVLPPGPN